MKNLALIFGILLMGVSAKADTFENEETLRRNYDGNAYTFIEGNVEFSVFPDGQFDFVYVGPQTGSQVTISTPNVNVSFNSGYNYEAYVQYDDYGAVIQVENIPIYYDAYGRITQAGSVDIQYNDRRIVRIGGLHVVYNNFGYFSHCTGTINVFNPFYVYRPWHVYYAPPIYAHCIVYDRPYRRYYNPIRYSYHDHVIYYKNRNRVAYTNGRRDFYRPGSRVYDKSGRSSINRDYNPNRRNTMIASRDNRSNNSVRDNSTPVRSNAATTRNVTRNSSTNSKGAVVRSNNSNNRNINRNVTDTKTTRTTTRATQNTTRKVASNPATTRKTNTRNSVSSNSRSKTVRNSGDTVTRNTNSRAPQRETVRSNSSNRNKSASSQRNSGNSSRGNSSRGRG
ncbi:hypothetical protein [Aequorivita echinoideorum]|uniref:Uncharacterized protein n=1 Tax=Aequorivita echinoideorum TaxID=1549647 RepID=A0ABS5S6T1_9FLAO|nr:hypothetical protein [Aequorivita echinoideorum]MBT0608918.1 hypothetical protein [Aequorivita echinoideorum]